MDTDKTLRLKFQLEHISSENLKWKKIKAENLDLDYSIIFEKDLADELMKQLEESIEYYTGDLTKVKVFGKYHEIPRQQVAYGDRNVSYKFSGVTIPSKPWTRELKHLRDLLERITDRSYNFVLVNRYRNGNDHIGEHRDDETDLDRNVPIASVSLGESREFVLKHGDARRRGEGRRNVQIVKLNLEHGSALMMNAPTNRFWYHSLPARRNKDGVRINLTFRKIIV